MSCPPVAGQQQDGEGLLMAKKIICESYGTIFPFDRVKDMDESEEELMYFDQIMIFQEDPELNVLSACSRAAA